MFITTLVLFGCVALNFAIPQNCPAVDGPQPVYIRDINCSKYWECSNGVPYEFSCPPGLNFNAQKSVCDWPDRAGCTEVQCPAVDGCEPVYFPDTDCTKFWECSNGVPYQFSCPGTTQFNPILKVCDWPDRAGCTGQQPTPSPTSPDSGCVTSVPA